MLVKEIRNTVSRTQIFCVRNIVAGAGKQVNIVSATLPWSSFATRRKEINSNSRALVSRRISLAEFCAHVFLLFCLSWGTDHLIFEGRAVGQFNTSKNSCTRKVGEEIMDK